MDAAHVATPDSDSPRVRRAPESLAHVARANRIVEQVDARDGQRLLGLARRSGLTQDTAEDAVQEALLRLWLEVRSGVDILDPRAWAFRTLYRIAVDHHRVRRRASDVVARLMPTFRTSIDSDEAERISIWSVVDKLPSRQRQVLYLRYKADMSFEQVAAVMGIAPSTARAHATFATGRLRYLMDAGSGS